jgi:hypothetical protein
MAGAGSALADLELRMTIKTLAAKGQPARDRAPTRTVRRHDPPTSSALPRVGSHSADDKKTDRVDERDRLVTSHVRPV